MTILHGTARADNTKERFSIIINFFSYAYKRQCLLRFTTLDVRGLVRPVYVIVPGRNHDIESGGEHAIQTELRIGIKLD